MSDKSERYRYAKDNTARWKIGYDERSDEEENMKKEIWILR